MNLTSFLLEADSGGQVQRITSTFGVDWPHLIAQIISFSIVCVLLQRFAYKPVLRVLEERRKKIAQGLDDAKKSAASLAEAEAERKEILRKAELQAAQLIEEARAAAARVNETETQKAIAAAQQIVEKAHEVAAQDYARMLRELKRHVGQLVVKTTTAVTGKILTAEDHRRLDEETAKQLVA
jgi:F-type H+-transporting ATPase subunit b